MSASFPEVFPPEIRNIIYKYVLASPTGCVSLMDTSESLSASSSFLIVPYDEQTAKSSQEPKEIITLALLRTCKRIHKECRDLFWKWNILMIGEPAEKSFSGLAKPYQFQPSGSMRSIQLDFNVGTLRKKDDLRFTLKMLVHWTRVGDLREIIINWDSKSLLGPKLSEEISSLLRSEFWYGINVKNRIVIKTKATEDDRRRTQYNNLLQTAFVLLLQEVFGGELRLDDFVCFRNCRMLTKGFDAGPDGKLIPVPVDIVSTTMMQPLETPHPNSPGSKKIKTIQVASTLGAR